MALRDLEAASMLNTTQAWIDPKGDRPTLEKDPSVKAFLPQIESAHHTLLQTQPKAGENAALLETLQASATTWDDRHDRKARGLYWVLLGLAELLDDAKDIDSVADTTNNLFPQGLEIVRHTYAEEAGEAIKLEQRVTPDNRAVLDQVTVQGRPLSTELDAWIGAGKKLGEIQTERDRLGHTEDQTEVTLKAAYLARREWVRTVNALLSLLDLSKSITEAEQTQLLSSLRKAEAAQKAKRNKR